MNVWQMMLLISEKILSPCIVVVFHIYFAIVRGLKSTFLYGSFLSAVDVT